MGHYKGLESTGMELLMRKVHETVWIGSGSKEIAKQPHFLLLPRSHTNGAASFLHELLLSARKQSRYHFYRLLAHKRGGLGTLHVEIATDTIQQCIATLGIGLNQQGKGAEPPLSWPERGIDRAEKGRRDLPPPVVGATWE
jgi:hypothetical protein